MPHATQAAAPQHLQAISGEPHAIVGDGEMDKTLRRRDAHLYPDQGGVGMAKNIEEAIPAEF
ncbi:MAG: hypothetical protein WDM77_03200 [Steroidobacteraceae bacterium]